MTPDDLASKCAEDLVYRYCPGKVTPLQNFVESYKQIILSHFGPVMQENDRLRQALNKIRIRSEPISGECPDEENWRICMKALPKEMFMTTEQALEILKTHDNP